MDLYPKRLQHMTLHDLGSLSWAFCRCFPCLSRPAIPYPVEASKHLRHSNKTHHACLGPVKHRLLVWLSSWEMFGFSIGQYWAKNIVYSLLLKCCWHLFRQTVLPGSCIFKPDWPPDFLASWPAWTNEEFASGWFVLERAGARRGRYSSKWPWQLDQSNWPGW